MTPIQHTMVKEAEEVKILLDRCITMMTPIRQEDFNMAKDAFHEKWGASWSEALRN